MTFVRRALAFVVTVALLGLAALYLPAPVSTVAWLILGILALLLFLPLVLALLNPITGIFSDDGEGWFSNILEIWFLWGALEWPWLLLGWIFGGGRRRRDGNGVSKVADTADIAAAAIPDIPDTAIADIPYDIVPDARPGRRQRRLRGRRRGRQRREG